MRIISSILGILITSIIPIIIDEDEEDLEADVELVSFMVDMDHSVLTLVPDTPASNQTSLTPLFLNNCMNNIFVILHTRALLCQLGIDYFYQLGSNHWSGATFMFLYHRFNGGISH